MDADLRRMSIDTQRSGESRISTDEEMIRRWANEHEAVPVQHRDEPADCRIIPPTEAEVSYERMDWPAFFAQLEDSDQVVIYHEQASAPFDVLSRDDAIVQSGDDQQDLEERLLEEGTVTRRERSSDQWEAPPPLSTFYADLVHRKV